MAPTMDSLKDVPEDALVAELRRRAVTSQSFDVAVAELVADLLGKVKSLECKIRSKDTEIYRLNKVITTRDEEKISP